MRIEHANVSRGEPVTFILDGVPATAYLGESIVAAILNSGGTRRRAVFCNMGGCGDCTVEATWPSGDTRHVRACITPVTPGLRVRCLGEL
jgi:sarcosine oxidase subunit alpha